MLFRSVNTLFAQADVCVVSSNYEGFGLVAAEAMASNVPVIASNVEGLNEVVAGAGILFEKGDYKELAQKIKELMSDSDLYANVQIKQEKRVLKYDIKSTTQKYLDVYTNLLKK